MAFISRFDSIVTAAKELDYVCAFCYTQVTDVQQEFNELMDICRNVKIEPEVIEEINKRNIWVKPKNPARTHLACRVESVNYFV